MKWKIGNIEIKNQIVLAPMAGISNPSYMKICEEMGVGYAIAELLSAEAIVRENKKTLEMLNGIDKLNIPVAIQIFGSDAATMAKAAQIITNLHQKVLIDINMGCPVPKVAIKNQAGSALLKDPQKIKKIVSSVVKAVSVPVTVKIRAGWDNEHINAVEVAKVCEEAGAKAIAIHARTRAQGYSGQADWSIIKNVKEAVSVPIIGNGDVTDCYLAKKMLEETGCDAVMIGRGLLGNPWLIRDCVNYLEDGSEPLEVSNKEKIDMMRYHYKLLCQDTNEISASLEIRSHILYYLKGMPKSKEMKNKICSCKNAKEIFACLDEYEAYLKEKEELE